jgi:endonuclease YncB( thermonuclease family)
VIEGRVVAVADGDTITLLDSNRQQHRIRLAGIDAPEKALPFGQRSKQHLSELAFEKEAKVDCYKVDRYDRDVCTVYVEGKDLGLAQLDAGLAWWFRKYLTNNCRRIASTTRRQRIGRQQIELSYGRTRTQCRPWDLRHQHH